ncbi:hypothetical protein B1964_29210 [Gordonia sp. i37]|nr:hypothetical protein B1964_29210 [Gordonia sp. i37]
MTLEERKETPIALPGVEADRYQYAFKGLPKWQTQELPCIRVFHGPLRYTSELRDEAGAFHIELYAGGEYEDGGFGAPWTLVLAHGEWSARARALLVDEFESARQEARTSRQIPQVYALARQDADNVNLLHVDRRSRIAFTKQQQK